MICPTCGDKNPDTQRYCQKCGASLSGTGKIEEVKEPQKETETSEAAEFEEKEIEVPSELQGKSDLEIGLGFLKRNQTDEAISFLKRSVAANPMDFRGHEFLAIAYGKKEMPEKAIQEFKEALAINPNSPILHYNLATTYRRQNLLEEARAEFEEALRLDPNLSRAREALDALGAAPTETETVVGEFITCANCGASNPKESKVCSLCGQALKPPPAEPTVKPTPLEPWVRVPPRAAAPPPPPPTALPGVPTAAPKPALSKGAIIWRMALCGILAGIIWAVIFVVAAGLLGFALLPAGGRGTGAAVAGFALAGIILFIVVGLIYGFLGLIIGVLAAAIGVRDYFNAAWLGAVVAGLPQVFLMVLLRSFGLLDLVLVIATGVLIGETCIWLFRMFFRPAWELYE